MTRPAGARPGATAKRAAAPASDAPRGPGAGTDSVPGALLLVGAEPRTRFVQRKIAAGHDAGMRPARAGSLAEALRLQDDHRFGAVVLIPPLADATVDESVLFALRSRDGGLRGTFVAAYGPQLEPDTVAAVEGLEARPHASGRDPT